MGPRRSPGSSSIERGDRRSVDRREPRREQIDTGGKVALVDHFGHRVDVAGAAADADRASAAARTLDRGAVLSAARQNRPLVGDAMALPFPDASFDLVTIAFGLRNVTEKPAALAEMRRILKVGGRLLVLEFSQVAEPLRKPYDWYSLKVLPVLGKWIGNDADSYRYLAESIRMHPDQDTLKAMMVEAGFERVTYHNMTGGIVALHRGIKP